MRHTLKALFVVATAAASFNAHAFGTDDPTAAVSRTVEDYVQNMPAQTRGNKQVRLTSDPTFTLPQNAALKFLYTVTVNRVSKAGHPSSRGEWALATNQDNEATVQADTYPAGSDEEDSSYLSSTSIVLKQVSVDEQSRPVIQVAASFRDVASVVTIRTHGMPGLPVPNYVTNGFSGMVKLSPGEPSRLKIDDTEMVIVATPL